MYSSLNTMYSFLLTTVTYLCAIGFSKWQSTKVFIFSIYSLLIISYSISVYVIIFYCVIFAP